MRNRLLLVVLFGLSTCGEDTRNPVPGITIEGIAIDPMLANAGIDSAWVIVGIGADEPLLALTDGDGRFAVDVPRNIPVDVTVGKIDYQTITWLGLDPSEDAGPWVFGPLRRGYDLYDDAVNKVTISGTVSGVPAGADMICIEGNDRWCINGGWMEPSPGTPVPYTFETRDWGGGDLTFSVLARTEGDVTQNYDLLDATLLTVPREDTVRDITLPSAQAVDLTVTSSSANISRVEIQVAGCYPVPVFRRPVVGTEWAEPAESQLVTSYFPQSGHSLHARVLMDLDPASGFIGDSVVYSPLSTGQTTLAVEALPAADVDVLSAFRPEAALTWTPVPGATHYTLQINDGGSGPGWVLATREPEFHFPQFPAGFLAGKMDPPNFWNLFAWEGPLDPSTMPTRDPIPANRYTVVEGGLVMYE